MNARDAIQSRDRILEIVIDLSTPHGTNDRIAWLKDEAWACGPYVEGA